MALTPAARRLLAMVHRVGAPRFHELTPAQARHSFHKLQFAFGPRPTAVGAADEHAIPRPDGSTLAARLYRPLAVSIHATPPLIVFYHGGGWCVGDLGGYDGFCRELANASDCAVLAVDYRLAPEHPFPAAPDDALHAVRWARAEAGRLRIDASRLALAGDSAGGNLAIVAALALRDGGEEAPRALLLAYPAVEMGGVRPSRQTFAEGFFLDREMLAWFFANYRADPADWRASPLRAASLAHLPPTVLIAAENDPLLDEGAAFAARVKNEGGEIDRIVVPGVVHGFFTLGRLFPEAATLLRQKAGEVGERLRTGELG